MNNKGFSLVELLAVIVILGIIGTIGVVSYQSVVQNAKDKVYTDYEKTMKSAAQMYIIKNGIPSEDRISLNNLLNGNYLDDFNESSSSSKCLDSYVLINKNATDKTDITYQACLICPNYRTKNC